MPDSLKISLREVRNAARVLSGLVHSTPLISCNAVDEISGREIFFKAEHLQKTGSFKFRGAYNALARSSRESLSKGVVTQSSGNHAQAVALAARLLGISAHVVVPSGAPKAKLDAIKAYGARITFCEPVLADRERVLDQVRTKTGAAYIPPYDHPDVIAGQGTVALELLTERGDIDAIVAPIGGGGLVSGIGIVAKSLRPGIRVVAAEPCGADDAARSKRSGRRERNSEPHSLADGLLAELGELTWPIVRDQVDAVVTISESEIRSAMRFMWERTKQLIEPSAAVAVAAILRRGEESLKDRRKVAVVLSGGNVTLDRLPW